MNPDALRDQVISGDLESITSAMYSVVNPLSQQTPARQLQAIVVLFHLIAAHYGMDKRDLLTIGNSILEFAEKTENQHVRAFHMYMKEELK